MTVALLGLAVMLSALPSNLYSASLTASILCHVNTLGLSGYKLLRLKNIQRNKGLFGITIRNNCNNGGGRSGEGGASAGGRGINGSGRMSKRARKGSNTRQQNSKRARDVVQWHQQWLTKKCSCVANDYGDSSNSNNGSDTSNLSRL